jgi:5-methylcytosine-specific restriction endonuclease McrA
MCSDQAIRTEGVRIQGAVSTAHADRIGFICERIESTDWYGDGVGSLDAWLAALWGMSRRDARRLIAEATATMARPPLVDALSSGEISVEQSRALMKVTAEGSDDAGHWLEVLPFWTYPELEREARRATARELDRRDSGTYLRMEHTPDERYMRGESQLHPEDGAAVLAAIDAQIPAGTLLRDWDQASARAFVELVIGDGAQRRPTVVMSVSQDLLAGKIGTDGVAALSSGGYVGAATAQRMACDASVQVVFTDDDGKIIAIDKSSHYIPPSTRRATHARDGGQCVFPSCEMDKYLDLHHIVPVEHGGPTVMANLITVCWKHHDAAHERGWSLQGDAGPNITWIKPDGTPFLPRARIVVDTS